MAAKTLGIITLLLTALYYSQSHQKTEDQKYGILAELCSLLSYIQKNIDCFTKPLGEICQGYTSPMLEQCGFYERWNAGDLKNAVCSIPYLNTQAKEILLRYTQAAGQGYKEEELHLCRFTREQLQEILTKQNEERKAKNKMYRTLPYLLVLSIVLFLY